MSLLFLLKVLLELVDASLQVSVNLNVTTNDAFHPTDVLIDIILDWADTLDIWNQLSFFCEELGCLFEVLEVPIEEFLLFLHNSVYFFVESQQLLGVNHLLSTTSSATLSEATDTLALVGAST